MAVIGSGPAGFYSAYKVMSIVKDAKVDMYDYLPIPFGLVRFGVAPDHPEVKNCQNKFTEVASSANFQFIGNIDIGRGLSLKALKEHYDAILFAYGASEDRKLDIPGEDQLKGIYSARHYVGWYNGLPEHAKLNPDLSTGDTAVVIGQGNVALDVARTLLTDIDVLRKTDMTDRALSALSKSKVKRVHVVGRRGPMQASFTIKEVRELLHLPQVSFHKIDDSLLPSPETKLSRTPRRLVSLLREGSPVSPSTADKSWSLDSMLSPERFVGDIDQSQLREVEFVENQFLNSAQQFESSARLASPIQGRTSAIPTTLAFRSIGYKSVAIDGMHDLQIHFDQKKGIIPNDSSGRIINASDAGAASIQADAENPLPGLYCAGWVKRGPVGVIANTMEDAFSTAEAVASDWENGRPFLSGGEGWDALSTQEETSRLRTVSWANWLKIDEAEKRLGKAKGKEREKFTTVLEMLSVLD